MTERGAIAPLSMRIRIADTPLRSRGTFRPSFAWSRYPPNPRGRREGRVPAGTRGPLRENAHAERTAQQHTGVADHSAFPAQWSDGLCRDLPGADHSFGLPRPANLDDAVCPVGLARTFAKDLTVATTVRTTRFCRTQLIRLRQEASPDFGAARPHVAAGSQGLPALPAPFAHDAAASTATRLTIKTTSRSPLLDEPGWTTHTPKPNFGKVEYFCERGLTEADTGKVR